jgi:hypothetical protein
VKEGERYVSLDGRGRRDDGLPVGPLGDSKGIRKRVNRIMGSSKGKQLELDVN